MKNDKQELRRYVKVEFDGSWFACEFTDLNNLLGGTLKDSDAGSSYTVSVVEMTEEAFKNLPEFDGF